MNSHRASRRIDSFPGALASLATGRTSDLFGEDLARNRPGIEARIRGRRVLVIGGAGSIGAATTALVSEFQPQSLHVVDWSENNLVELVRDLRSRREGLNVPDFRALPLDFGSPLMRRFLGGEPPYDVVLNFAALKHVRSEKDVCSLLQMLDTNIVKAWRFWQWLQESGAAGTFFSVSTDKAANPVNLMGASKRIMEHLMLSSRGAIRPEARATTSRFANVAFSDGSLLVGFLKRIEKQQPLGCPRDTRRFFISLREAGQICLLAAICGPDRHIVVPKLDASADLRTLEEVAFAFLRRQGLEPAIYSDEPAARAAVRDELAKGRYPLLLTPLDTMGEKPYEEFVGAGESVCDFEMSSLRAVGYLPLPRPELLPEFVENIAGLIACPDATLDKARIVDMMRAVVPELQHAETPLGLDQRM